jgi:hypothetical protein
MQALLGLIQLCSFIEFSVFYSKNSIGVYDYQCVGCDIILITKPAWVVRVLLIISSSKCNIGRCVAASARFLQPTYAFVCPEVSNNSS